MLAPGTGVFFRSPPSAASLAGDHRLPARWGCYHPGVRTADFDYHLPEALVAQHARCRGTSRLLVLERATGDVRLERVTALPALLRPGDLLVLNDVKVIPARLRAERPGGGKTELLLVRPLGDGSWEVMARPAKRLQPGVWLRLRSGAAVPLRRMNEGRWQVAFEPPLGAAQMEVAGEVPLPPYIHREAGPSADDRRRYQTVYAQQGRAVAAPTAGLHFTPELLMAVAARGVELCRLTLHVGPGTFRPVQTEDPRDHRLDTEDYVLSPEAAAAVNRARAAGRRIVAVGTTSCRALEHAATAGRGLVRPGAGNADLFIVPGFRFRVVDGLLTNFHLPRSTLLMLVSALAGRSRALGAYAVATAQRFRFYSFGDAMLVL
ncbi:MAG: tRNA preQ1(34) S-adenosylmethionine ribosyltransferase-isomerase QueA [Thermoanaerobaculaceae bacterium]|nr:tRNA preQ1(34) S-adenosylmethionine ribosyltransferase-isomerase QueA [Thermoanaerobaculaceae bacterium]